MEEANRYINEIFLPRYNARFASSINCNKNHFIPVPKDFDYNRKLATWTKRKVINNCYVSIDNKYYALKRNNQIAHIVSLEKLPVYLYLDGSRHLYYKDEIYDLELIPKLLIKPNITQTKRLTEDEMTRIRSENGRNSKSPWHNHNNFVYGNKLKHQATF